MSCAWKRVLKWFTACGHLSDNNLKRPRFFDMTCAIKLQPDEKKNETVKWARVAHPHTVRCVGTLHRSRSSSLSCRLQCLASSFFTPPPTPPGKERGCVCLCEKHTWQRGRPKTPPSTVRPQAPPCSSRPRLPSPPPLSAPPSHLLPEPPEGRDGSVSGAGDVTLGNLRFWSSEEWIGGTISLCLQCTQTLVYACESWNSFCLQLRYCIQLAVGSFYRLLCRLISFLRKNFVVLRFSWGFLFFI